MMRILAKALREGGAQALKEAIIEAIARNQKAMILKYRAKILVRQWHAI